MTSVLVGCLDFSLVEQDSDVPDSGKTEMETESNIDTDVDTDTDADSDSDTDTDTDSDSDTDVDTDTDMDTDSDTDTDSDSNTDPFGNTDADTALGSDTSSDTSTQTDSDSDTTVNHPCFNVLCSSPNNTCQGSQIFVYDRAHYCRLADNSTPECVYPERQESCNKTGGCQKCSGANCSAFCADVPCEYAFCDTPPPPECEGNDALRYTKSGRCDPLSGCQYDTIRVSCETACDKGRCTADPCAGVVCNAPPPRYCDNGDLVIWNPVGSCDDAGQCRYTYHRLPCNGDCVEGHCVNTHPCAAETCLTPPANYCLDDTQLVTFDPRGICQGDTASACHYERDIVTCPGQCSGGRCEDDLCVGIRCLDPPAPSCKDSNTLRTLDPDGVLGECSAGVCQWDMTEIPCPAGCKNGRCIDDPCVGIATYCTATPFAPDHCDGTTAIQYDPNGQCNADGLCEYEASRIVCTATGCDLGSCVK